jgi:hypothetical protein
MAIARHIHAIDDEEPLAAALVPFAVEDVGDDVVSVGRVLLYRPAID